MLPFASTSLSPQTTFSEALIFGVFVVVLSVYFGIQKKLPQLWSLLCKKKQYNPVSVPWLFYVVHCYVAQCSVI